MLMASKDNLRKVVSWLVMQGRATSQGDLAVQMGYNPSAFSQVLNGRVPLSNKFLRRLKQFEPQVSIDWIQTGRGSMIEGKRADIETVLVDGEEAEFYTENKRGARFYKKGDQLYITVKHVPYAAFGQFANDSDRLDPINDEWEEETYEADLVARGNYLSFEVQGASMDIGTRQSFEAGDKVLVRELERDLWRERIWYDKHPYWVVVFGASVLLKQIINHDTVNGTFTFHSLNPSPEYADFTLNQDDVRALYYVIRKKPKERKC